MRDSALNSNDQITTNNTLQGVTNYWLWTPAKETTTHEKEISDAVIECLQLFARYGRITDTKEQALK